MVPMIFWNRSQFPVINKTVRNPTENTILDSKAYTKTAPLASTMGFPGGHCTTPHPDLLHASVTIASTSVVPPLSVSQQGRRRDFAKRGCPDPVRAVVPTIAAEPTHHATEVARKRSRSGAAQTCAAAF